MRSTAKPCKSHTRPVFSFSNPSRFRLCTGDSLTGEMPNSPEWLKKAGQTFLSAFGRSPKRRERLKKMGEKKRARS